MIKIKLRENETVDSFLKRFKRSSFFEIRKFKEREYFIKPEKLKERRRTEKRKMLFKFRR